MKLKRITTRLRKFFTYILVYLTVAGAYTFTAFIIEEAEQQVIWGTWPAQDAKNWELVLEGCDILESLNHTMKVINWSIGYIQPLALIAYHSYWKSTAYYIKSLKGNVFAKAPEVFDGRHVEFMFTPQKIIQESDQGESSQVILVNRKIRVMVDEAPSSIKRMKITGMVRVEGGLIYVEKDKKQEKDKKKGKIK